MPNRSTDISLAVTLELEGEIKLAGNLTLSDAGQPTLSSARLVSSGKGGGRVRLQAGAAGRLDCASPVLTAQVTITGAAERSVQLEFFDQEGSDAQFYIKQFQPTAEDDVVADTASAASNTGSTGTASLAELRELSLNQLTELMRKFMEELLNYLFAESTRSRQVSGHDGYYEALNAVRSKGKQISKDFLQHISDHFEDLTPNSTIAKAAQPMPQSAESLNLVDLRDFEDHLAIARMVKIGEDLHQVALESLLFRTAEIIDADPNQVRLPLHVAQLCAAFRKAIEGKGIPADLMPAIFDFFVSDFIRKLDECYQPVNDALAKKGIRPGIEDEIRERGSLLNTSQAKPPEREKKPTTPPVITSEPAAEPLESDGFLSEQAVAAGDGGYLGQPTPTAPSQPDASPGMHFDGHYANPEDQARYQSVLNALNARRESEGLTGSSNPASWSSGNSGGNLVPQLTDQRSLANALGGLQADAGVRQALAQAGSLRQYLSENSDKIQGLEGSSGLTAESLNQLDLVDNLFGTIESQVDLATSLQPQLENLQIPLAKLALLEPEFFLNRDHAAREVVDKLAHLGSSANFPNPALESRIGDIVSEIVSNYEQDSSVFKSALTRIDKLSQQQERAAKRNQERVVSAQEGKQKLERAQQIVNQELGARIRPPQAPQALLDLVDSGFRDLMVQTQLKEGPESAAWQEQLASLDQLTQWLEPSDEAPDADTRVQRSLEAEPLLDMIGQQITNAIPTQVKHQSVLDKLRQLMASDSPVPLGPVPEELTNTPVDGAQQRSRIEDLPRLRRWVRRVESLKTGSWLTYRDSKGQPQRMKLAWTNPDKDRYIFVNERGQKHADLSSVQLARQLSRGMSPPDDAQKMSLVDQSMYSTLEHVQQTLSFDRNHDALTRLINKDTLIEQMQRALRHAQRKDSKHVALYLDVDQFQLVNQVYGRDSGDQILAEFGKLLAQLHGKKASSARIEEDAFGILLLDRPMEESLRFAEKVRADIAESSVDIDGEGVSFTVSIGVAPLLDHSVSVEKVLEDAHTAMRIAKDQGRNQVVEFSEDQKEIERQRKVRSDSQQDLEQALASERFSLRAQPIVRSTLDGKSSNNSHYELLLSIKNPDGSPSSPGEFIQSAETYGFMSMVDRWVIKEAFNWIHSLMDDQKEVPGLSINLSGSSITDDSFLDYLLEQISEYGVGTSLLCFEITEAGTISNMVKAADFIRTLRDIGCKFSIDDFGTGLSSHNFLRELPVDFVKIDGSFVKEIHRNHNDLAMVRSINDLAHFMGQQTIAESVESEEAVAILKDIGVDFLQGWALARPKPLEDIANELSSIEK